MTPMCLDQPAEAQQWMTVTVHQLWVRREKALQCRQQQRHETGQMSFHIFKSTGNSESLTVSLHSPSYFTFSQQGRRMSVCNSFPQHSAGLQLRKITLWTVFKHWKIQIFKKIFWSHRRKPQRGFLAPNWRTCPVLNWQKSLFLGEKFSKCCEAEI